MARLPMPDLPEGNLRDLIAELHSLHARAGWPSVREMAKGKRFSYNAVHELFTKPDGQPRLPLLLAVVEGLATMDPRADTEQVLDKFDQLWQAAKVATVGDDRTPNLLAQLTARERTVLALLLRGVPAIDIARTLGISRGTGRSYVGRVYRKLGVGHRSELVARAEALGFDGEEFP